MSQEKVTPEIIKGKKQKGENITALTAYDYPTALCLNDAGIDIVLVGDSLGMVVLGHANTLKVTMENMLDHCRAVARGNSTALLVADMPFLTCTTSVADAVRNAGRMIQEGDMEAVKVEGGTDVAQTISAIVRAGIPVLGHIGFTPQQVLRSGRKRVQGRDRTVEVRGSCGCGAGDFVAYGYDGFGHVVREQGADGYITVRQWEPGPTGRLLAITAGYKLQGCDRKTEVDHWGRFQLYNGKSDQVGATAYGER